MISSLFDTLLKDLEGFFNCPLLSEGGQSCIVNMGIGISLQIELSPNNDLLIGCVVGTLPLNRYRDNLFLRALQFNDLYPPSTGVFGYSSKTNHLILFLSINPSRINSEEIFVLLPPYIEKAKQWKEAIDAGDTPVASYPVTSPPTNVFGLIR